MTAQKTIRMVLFSFEGVAPLVTVYMGFVLLIKKGSNRVIKKTVY